MKLFTLLLVLFFVALGHATIFFSEDFGQGWEKRWVQSKTGDNLGKFVSGSTPYRGHTGIKTSEDARFYRLISEFPSFSNKDKPLVLQFSAAHPQDIDCGGGYIKLHPKLADLSDYHGDSPYNIMFGPDFCGPSTRKVHLIFSYKGQNHLIRDEIPATHDKVTHLYTLILKPDNTFEVLLDNQQVRQGSLKTAFDMLPPKEINDPNAHKPSDWVDERMIADPDDKKPEGWDDIPAEIRDPDAKKPEDWDDELDGEWEVPMIRNPEFKGSWKPKMIPNPAYKGEWVHPKVPNPDYKDDDNLYLYPNNAAVGFELWQVKSGSVFSDILVTDSVEQANAAAVTIMESLRDEKAKFDAAQEEELKKAQEQATDSPTDEL